MRVVNWLNARTANRFVTASWATMRLMSSRSKVLRICLCSSYRAALEFFFYHDYWLISLTLVLHKPGKPAYNVVKAYCPIGLLNTISKLLSILIVADISHLVETHNVLPPGQFGG